MVYLDSSLICSLYWKDSNSTPAHQLIVSVTDTLLITSLCELETTNAFNLGRFRGELSASEADQLRSNFENDLGVGFYLRRTLPDSSFTRARALAQTLTPSIGVRSADLLHVAAAFELGADSMYTFDLKQHKTAQAAGLKVNPLP